MKTFSTFMDIMLLVNDMIKVQNRSQGPKSIPRSKIDPEVQNQPRGPKLTPRSKIDLEVQNGPQGPKWTPRSKMDPKIQNGPLGLKWTPSLVSNMIFTFLFIVLWL